ncbi:serine/threonine protein kinase [Nonomuraea terrae]|uniref:non-specific serine/threonine protein kinase n=1 Tax=Nonomuraea terrae TaxID=2530383 RepID=A0A4R4YPL0_9ACTN|nr:serine/threonine-protein kinase [Nonomuraea terrae]TDD45462.1 serine/threonine protein kinase [Nonomuraea terrae]
MDLGGRYRLERRLGKGAMGEVWRALDLRLDRPVAVKLMAPDSGNEARRFLREGKLAARINHPGVTTVFDVDRHGRRLFIVMELLNGRDLGAVIRDHADGLELSDVFDIGRQLAAALGAAHALGIVHRDLKPRNIVLLDGGTVKICDFGIARAVDATRITRTGLTVGTPAYMAPEQFGGSGVDRRADLYSLGCVLHELCTGRVPFPASNIAHAMYGHLNTPPPSPATGNRELDALVLSLLAKDPARRPQHADEVARWLRRIARRHRPDRAATRSALDLYHATFTSLMDAAIERQDHEAAARLREQEKVYLRMRQAFEREG